MSCCLEICCWECSWLGVRRVSGLVTNGFGINTKHRELIVINFMQNLYSKTNQMHQRFKFIYFAMALYMFRTVFPSTMRSSRLHAAAGICQTGTADCLQAVSSTDCLQAVSSICFGMCLLLYVQSWTPDDGRKDRPKHVECHSKINLRHWCI